MERYHTTHIYPTERLASMHHTILGPLTRRHQLRIARLLALSLLPLLLLSTTGHAAERFPGHRLLQPSAILVTTRPLVDDDRNATTASPSQQGYRYERTSFPRPDGAYA